ncbi:ATP-binding protein [Aureimonas sp. AU40]|uniref:ATP-binding protein n=1 Tax=Aureimonas sp. AU40 TaxID=1637747 RepID=UPI000781183E|nr:ATP-binding protein [Aureimonas sp. AU40]
MVLPAVRVANAIGSAVAVLSADLAAVLWCNAAGAALLALPGGRRSSGEDATSPLLPQIGSARQTLTLKRRTQLLLRPADAGMGRAVLARLEAMPDGSGEESAWVLLTVRLDGAPSETREAFARRLVQEAGLTEALACVVSDTGFVWGTPNLPAEEQSLLAAQGAEFLRAGEERLTVEDEYGALSFAKVAEGLVLIHIDTPDAGDDAVAAPVSNEAVSEDGSAKIAESIEQGLDTDPSLLPVESAPTLVLAVEPEAPEPALLQPSFEAPLNGEPKRFVWQIDEDGRFSSLSTDFSAVVGPHSADVIGRAFTDVARVYGFDENGEIARLLERRDTWSGRSILWPIEGTDRKAPVDLAALPIYSRDRRFEGFRGFGVVRPAEHVADPDALGLVLRSGLPVPQEPEADETEDEAEIRAAFGRREQAPETESERAERRHRRELALSSAEEAAFRAIGAELGVSPRNVLPLKPQGADARRAEPAAPEPTNVEPVTFEPEPVEEAVPFAAHELEDMFDALPLAVLVQMGDRLLFANKRFFSLTRYSDLDALEESGGLDRLVLSCGESGEGDEAVIQCGDGTMERARLHLQRVSVAGRSCLLMSFTEAREPPDDLLAGEVVDLQREVDELQAVLDTATDGILLLDAGERVRKMNGAAEALFGLTPDFYLGLPFVELLVPESRQTARDYIETLRDNGLASILNDGREVHAKVGPDKARGGEQGTIPLFVTLGRLSDGRGWCVVIRDIAQWKQAEKDLVEARKQAEDASLHKSRFLANVSHELRTPLNAIIGFADVMASECFGPIGHERYLEYLGDIKRSGHHVLDLVNDLLDISKIEAGKIELSFESVSLHEIVAEVVSLMQPQANRERVIVRSVLPASVPPVVADRRSVRQIALNLIANAVRFTPAGGQIVASTHYGEDGTVCLRVRDSGIGMTEHEVEIALTPFQQVKAGGRGEGTGLGLPLTKAMVEANRAQFSIASTPGEGTLVEITFPPSRVLAV